MPEKEHKISKKRKSAAAEGAPKRKKAKSSNPAARESEEIKEKFTPAVVPPIAVPKIDKSDWERNGKPQVVFVLESAGIAITDLGRRRNQVLQHDKDGSFLDAKQQPTWLFRPDIVHQTLLAIFDMPLCKEGHVKVYINTIKHKAIEVSSTTRIPRTFKRFCGLISQLIDQKKVINPETDQPLFKVLDYPIRQYVQENAPIYGLCYSEFTDPVNSYQFVEKLQKPKKRSDPYAYFVIPCRDNALWPEEEEGFGTYIQEKLCITQYEVCHSFFTHFFYISFLSIRHHPSR